MADVMTDEELFPSRKLSLAFLVIAHERASGCLTSSTIAFPRSQVGNALISIDHAGKTGIQTKDTTDTRAEPEKGIKHVEPKILPVPSHPSLDAAVDVGNCSGSGIVSILRKDGVALHSEAQHEEWGECVRELQDGTGSHQNNPGIDLRHRLGNNPGRDPVDGHNDHKDPFALLGFEARPAKKISAHVVVQDFDANVTVHDSSDETAEKT